MQTQHRPATKRDANDSKRSYIYKPRAPHDGVLHQVLVNHLESFIAAAESADGNGIPYFVEKELRAYLTCGSLAAGFARFRCSSCSTERLVAFSCKGRGICPSCGGRRMTQLAADLVDHVIPFVPVRQFVLSFPHRMRYLLAYDHARAIGVIRICVRAIMSFYRQRVKRKGISGGRTGSVTFIQRFGSAANLNLHAHVLMLDGVFTENSDGELHFQRAAPLRDQELHELLLRIRKRVLRYLHRQGLLEDEHNIDPFSDESPVLASCYATSIGGRQMLGERPGSKLQRVGHDPRASWIQSRGPLQAHIDGFDLHAKLTIASHTKKGRLPLEKIARYCARPPFSQDRLTQLHDGRISLELKTPWHDGTTHVLYSPLDFLARLAALIPAPRKNLVLYHGVLAPNSKWRQRAVTYRRPIDSESAQKPGIRINKDKVTPPRIRRSWAELMIRAFGFDLLTCPNCGSKMTLIACILERSAIRKILTHLALPDGLPTLIPARPPPGSEAAIDHYA